MPERSAAKLNRLLRVRTLQLGLVRAEESAAHLRLAGESELRARIAQLAAGVAPRDDAGVSFAAAAHYRERLHHSAHAAEARLRAAQDGLSHAQDATREAKRDQSAIEKLIARAEAEAVARELRALEAAPPVRRVRHDPC